MTAVAPYLKAVVGGLVAGLTALATALDNDSISAQEWLYAVIALLVGFSTVWAVPNRPPTTATKKK
jgi:hypothetical protein